MGFEMDRHPVGRGIDRIAEGRGPGLDLGDERIGRLRGGRIGHKARPGGGSTGQEGAAAGSGFVGHLANAPVCQIPVTATEGLGSSRTVPSFLICASTRSQIWGPSVPSFTLAQPPTV